MSKDYDKDDMPGALKRLAKMKVQNKMSKTGKMLDDMEMKQAPRRPFVTKAKKLPYDKSKSVKPKTLPMKPGMIKNAQLMKKKDK